MAATLLAFIGVTAFLISGRDRPMVQREADSRNAKIWSAVDRGGPEATSDRIVYAYSVVPGGAYTAEEFTSAIQRDAVVAAHYQDVEARQLRVETVSEDRLVHVSYRTKDGIYWTGRKVRLQQGETVLTDGRTMIRTRCGNRISDQPVAPVLQNEPDPAELDRPVEPPAIPVAQEPLIPAGQLAEVPLVPSLSLYTPPELVPVAFEFTRGTTPVVLPPVRQDWSIPVEPGPATPVPEPSTIMLVGVGSAATLLQRWRARRRDRRKD